jgi:hypothetical protein
VIRAQRARYYLRSRFFSPPAKFYDFGTTPQKRRIIRGAMEDRELLKLAWDLALRGAGPCFHHKQKGVPCSSRVLCELPDGTILQCGLESTVPRHEFRVQVHSSCRDNSVRHIGDSNAGIPWTARATPASNGVTTRLPAESARASSKLCSAAEGKRPRSAR